MAETDRVAIVTDSAACVPARLEQEYNIHIVPYQLVWDDQVYRDGVDLTPAEFYRRFQESPTYPTTAQPTLGNLVEVYRQLAGHASGIVSIHVPMGLSSTVSTARLAAREVSVVPIEVIDAQTAATPQGFIVLAAARAAQKGATLRQVVTIAQAYRERVGMYATLKTLEHLHRGGRVVQTAALLGSRLRIQPVFTLINGQVQVVTLARSRERAKARILEELRERVGERPLRASVMHANAAGEAEQLARQVQEHLHCIEFFISEFTPVMGAHTGPGVIGVAFALEDEEI